MRENTIKLMKVVLIVLVIVCCSKIVHKHFLSYKDRKTYSEVNEIKPIVGIKTTNKTNTKEKDSIQKKGSTLEASKENKLKNINFDYKLWIKIPNTNIDYPVVQGSDNEFYLHNNFYKEKSISGSIFVDYRNNLKGDKNTILYGHHMKDGTMFNQINKFKKVDNFNNGVIKIIKNNKEYDYVVFSVFVLDERHDNLSIRFTKDKDYMNYIKYLKEKSIYKKNIEGNNYDKIITLYTCSYEFANAKTIVCAVLKE
ncbi:class B sortase [Clostridium algoriphilum]|uniref:class B sortase n=1 Tax=Clostridium algoriphilum TaxID=198347 RepID=UPI001CF26CA8|nr:class B sortase [Clostridium algoriphilum]MCB2294959.1 class B sortase [Clostridium algoriphilum]